MSRLAVDYAIAVCCREWPVNPLAPMGRCGDCGNRPVINPAISVASYMRRQAKRRAANTAEAVR